MSSRRGCEAGRMATGTWLLFHWLAVLKVGSLPTPRSRVCSHPILVGARRASKGTSMGCGASKDAPPAGGGSAPAAKPAEPPPPKPAENTAVQAATDTADAVVQKPAAAAAAATSAAPPAKPFSQSSLEDLPDLDNDSLPPEAIRQLSADIDAELESIMKAGDDAQAKDMFEKFDKVPRIHRSRVRQQPSCSQSASLLVRKCDDSCRTLHRLRGRTGRARWRSRSSRRSSSRSTSS